MSGAVEKALDAIYAGPPAKFVKGRDAMAKKLRADGRDDEAARVKRLKKPSRAAAVLNALALTEPKQVKKYLGLADKLRKATSGKVDVKRMRELAREEGELLEELVAAAGQVRDEVSTSTLDRIRETLQAAQVDAELRDQVLAGRIEREARAASVGLENLAAPPKASPRKRSPRTGTNDAPKKTAATSRKRRGEAKKALSDAKAEAREAAREIARAQKVLAKAERDQAAADGRVERAAAKLERL